MLKVEQNQRTFILPPPALTMKIYNYIVHDSSTLREEFLKSFLNFLLIRGLIKVLSRN